MKKTVIIVAGGIGSRMKSDVPKQFLLLKGIPVLMQTIVAFSKNVPGLSIIVVLPANQIDKWKILCEQYTFGVPHLIAAGGETRYESVKNGLCLISEKCIVAIHDAARPLVSAALIQSAFQVAEEKGNAIPCIELCDSIRQVTQDGNQSINRSDFRIIQTPQCFDSDILKKAYDSPYLNNFTDDASVVESYGEHINLIEGHRDNIKITTPSDLKIAEALMD